MREEHLDNGSIFGKNNEWVARTQKGLVICESDSMENCQRDVSSFYRNYLEGKKYVLKFRPKTGFCDFSVYLIKQK